MTTSEPRNPPMAVIGAGIIGTTVAYALRRRGLAVTLIDHAEPGRGASFGNMANISATEFMAVSRPAVWKQMPGWLLDPEGPIRFDPRYMVRMLPWLMHFLKASRPSRVTAIEKAGAVLSRRIYDDLDPLLAETGLQSMLSREGTLLVYADEAEVAVDREHINVLERYGLPFERLHSKVLHELEPELSPEIKEAIMLPQNRTMADPYRLVHALFEKFIEAGGTFQRGDVAGFERTGSAVAALRLVDGHRVPVSGAVLCAGAFTGKLAKQLGEPIPLETERGYHTQIMEPGLTLNHAIIRPARAFMVVPTAGGVRVGGTVEMAGLVAPPDYRRSKITVKRAKEILPALKTGGTSEWMGHRPALPDTIPIISRSAKTEGVFYATGHGHLGLSYAATTSRLVADLVTGQTPPVDMTPYRVNRF